MAVKAVKKVIDLEHDDNVNLKMIKIVQKVGETVEESELIDGAIIEQKSMGRGGPTKVEKAKIGLIQFQISPPKTDVSFISQKNHTFIFCKKSSISWKYPLRWFLKIFHQKTQKYGFLVKGKLN